MKLLTGLPRAQLWENGRANAAHIPRDGDTQDFQPVVKLFCPWEPLLGTMGLRHGAHFAFTLPSRRYPV